MVARIFDPPMNPSILMTPTAFWTVSRSVVFQVYDTLWHSERHSLTLRILKRRIQMLMIVCSNVGDTPWLWGFWNDEYKCWWYFVQMLVRILKKRNPPWFWRVPKSIFGLGTRQNHGKTECFRCLPAPRSTASPIFIQKWTGCREWCCFVYYFVGSLSTHKS